MRESIPSQGTTFKCSFGSTLKNKWVMIKIRCNTSVFLDELAVPSKIPFLIKSGMTVSSKQSRSVNSLINVKKKPTMPFCRDDDQ